MSVSSTGHVDVSPYDRLTSLSTREPVSPGASASGSPDEAKESVAVIVSISAAAQAAARGLNANQVRQADQFARNAAAISEAQGLPPGKYDFTRMSANQMNTVVSDLIVNHGASLDDFTGINATLPDYFQGDSSPDTPVDFIANMKQAMAFQTETGNMLGAAWLQISISALGRYKGLQG